MALSTSSASAQLIDSISSAQAWFHADAGITTSGANVTSWGSTIGSVTATGAAGSQPTYVASSPQFNNRPAISFSGADNSDFLTFSSTITLATASSSPTTSDMSLFAVVQSDAVPGNTGFFLGRTNADTKIGPWANGLFARLGANPQAQFTWSIGTNPGMIYLDRNAGNASDPNRVRGSMNGGALSNGTLQTGVVALNYIGRDDGRVQDFPGDVAELIFFDSQINDAQRILVENYLSAKYNIALVQNDFYTGDDPLSGNFDSNVFGVGRTAAGSEHLSSSDAGLGFTVASGALADGDFIMAGHASDTNGLLPIDSANYTDGERWQREWFINTNDSSAALQIAFDFAEAGMGMPDPNDEYSLLFKLTDDDDYSIIQLGGIISGDSVLFDLNANEIGNGIITLGVNVEAVPEPASIALWSVLGMALVGVAYRRRSSGASR